MYPRPPGSAALAGPAPVPCARAIEGLQLACAGRLGRRGDGGAAGRLPGRLPQLRHDLRAGLGTRTGARGQPRLRRRAAPHPAPADRPAGAGHDAARRRRDHGDDDRRLRLPGPDRLPRLPARHALVRPLDRRRRRRDRPHPGALPLQRPARLHRPPLHRPLPRRADDRGQAPARRLAGPRPARPRRPAAPRGLALRRRLLALARLRPPTPHVDGPKTRLYGRESAHQRVVGMGAELAGGAGAGELAWLAVLAAAGPVLWVLFDAITTGNRSTR